MKIYKPHEITEIFENLKQKVEYGYNLSNACKACGYPVTIMNSPKMVEHKSVLKAIIASRNKVKPKKVNKDYVVPQKSPYKPIYQKLLKEDNYLV